MNLIFFGDLAAPEEDDVEIIKNFIKKTDIFKNKVVVGNLEGVLVKNKEYANSLYNNSRVIELFTTSTKTILSLANNHIKDIPEEFNETIEILEKNNIGYSGAINQKNNKGKLNPYEVTINGIKFAIFNHCWKVMSNIMKNRAKEIKVEDDEYEIFINKIKEYIEKNQKTKIIVYFHWNFDFEKYPFPSQRVIARKLIDLGVSIVVGSHSHLVNGGEMYKGKPIVYGFGNFYIPSKKFFKGKLNYPEDSDTTMLLEINTESSDVKVFWIKYDRESKEINLLSEESFEDGKIIEKYSEYRTIDSKEYKKFFRKNRSKNKFVPIWYNEKSNAINKLKDKFILLRMKLFRFIKKIIKK